MPLGLANVLRGFFLLIFPLCAFQRQVLDKFFQKIYVC